MKRTNEMIFAEVESTGFVTERDILLIKNRSNKEGCDLWDYDLSARITPEQGLKGLNWLRKKFFKKNGEPRVSCPFGLSDIITIKNASPEDFVFEGFINVGTWCERFEPVYTLGSRLRYYVWLGEIHLC